MTGLSMLELSVQDADLLPAREALQGTNIATISLFNLAAAIPQSVGTATAEATQTLVVLQS